MSRNRFFVMRHGQSVANETGKIISSPETGTRKYGLTAVGETQTRESVTRFLEQAARPTRIVTSDFRRAIETARIAADLSGAPLEIRTDLRERYFGDFEGQSSDHYEAVWGHDRTDPTHRLGNVESVKSVVDRMIGLTKLLESQWEDEVILLVSHGDPLQILLAVMNDLGGSRHRELPSLENAEIRFLPLRDANAG